MSQPSVGGNAAGKVNLQYYKEPAAAARLRGWQMDETPERPLVSVVVPALNEELWLERCICALQRKQTAVPYEIIVVDNGSTDGTAGLAERLGVRVVHESRRGLTFARQAGQDAARGAIVAHTDA